MLVPLKRVRKLFLARPIIKKLVDEEIGDLIYNDTLELMPLKGELKKILLSRGFKERSGLKYDFVKYIEKNLRIHIKCPGKNCYYHLDNH